MKAYTIIETDESTLEALIRDNNTGALLYYKLDSDESLEAFKPGSTIVI